jgi:F0F1-type ATP synthase membrane subunit c/vacuolar-type H+-ATPase subunit K
MLEGAKSIGAGAATIASAGAAVGIGNVFSSLIHSVALRCWMLLINRTGRGIT